MNSIRKTACLMLVLPGLLLSACSSKIPEATSEDWSLYARTLDGSRLVVNGYGQPEYDYALDKKGNVIDIGRNILIGAENVSEFIELESVVPEKKEDLEIRVDTRIVEVEDRENGSYAGGGIRKRIEEPVPKDVELTFELAPENAMCKCVTASCSGSGVLELPGADSEGTVTVTAEEGESRVRLNLRALDEGTGRLVLSSADGNIREEFEVTVTRNETPINEEEFRSTSSRVSEEKTGSKSGTAVITEQSGLSSGSPDAIPTTENTPGWLTGSRTNLRKEPGTTSEILGTYTGGQSLTILGSGNGWTKVQIGQITGYVKSVYITRTDPNPSPEKPEEKTEAGALTASGNSANGNSAVSSASVGTGSSGTENPVNLNAPIAANDGADHGYAFSAEAVPLGQEGHAHDYRIVSVVKPTENTKGYTVYACSCGATYRGSFTEYEGTDSGHVHSYTERIQNPTCEEIGYTEHVCSCGDTWRDGFVNAAGHHLVQETGSDGTVRLVCTVCGAVFPEETEDWDE